MSLDAPLAHFAYGTQVPRTYLRWSSRSAVRGLPKQPALEVAKVEAAQLDPQRSARERSTTVPLSVAWPDRLPGYLFLLLYEDDRHLPQLMFQDYRAKERAERDQDHEQEFVDQRDPWAYVVLRRAPGGEVEVVSATRARAPEEVHYDGATFDLGLTIDGGGPETTWRVSQIPAIFGVALDTREFDWELGVDSIWIPLAAGEGPGSYAAYQAKHQELNPWTLTEAGLEALSAEGFAAERGRTTAVSSLRWGSDRVLFYGIVKPPGAPSEAPVEAKVGDERLLLSDRWVFCLRWGWSHQRGQRVYRLGGEVIHLLSGMQTERVSYDCELEYRRTGDRKRALRPLRELSYALAPTARRGHLGDVRFSVSEAELQNPSKKRAAFYDAVTSRRAYWLLPIGYHPETGLPSLRRGREPFSVRGQVSLRDLERVEPFAGRLAERLYQGYYAWRIEDPWAVFRHHFGRVLEHLAETEHWLKRSRDYYAAHELELSTWTDVVGPVFDALGEIPLKVDRGYGYSRTGTLREHTAERGSEQEVRRRGLIYHQGTLYRLGVLRDLRRKAQAALRKALRSFAREDVTSVFDSLRFLDEGRTIQVAPIARRSGADRSEIREHQDLSYDSGLKLYVLESFKNHFALLAQPPGWHLERERAADERRRQARALQPAPVAGKEPPPPERWREYLEQLVASTRESARLAEAQRDRAALQEEVDQLERQELFAKLIGARYATLFREFLRERKGQEPRIPETLDGVGYSSSLGPTYAAKWFKSLPSDLGIWDSLTHTGVSLYVQGHHHHAALAIHTATGDPALWDRILSGKMNAEDWGQVEEASKKYWGVGEEAAALGRMKTTIAGIATLANVFEASYAFYGKAKKGELRAKDYFDFTRAALSGVDYVLSVAQQIKPAMLRLERGAGGAVSFAYTKIGQEALERSTREGVQLVDAYDELLKQGKLGKMAKAGRYLGHVVNVLSLVDSFITTREMLALEDEGFEVSPFKLTIKALELVTAIVALSGGAGAAFAALAGGLLLLAELVYDMVTEGPFEAIPNWWFRTPWGLNLYQDHDVIPLEDAERIFTLCVVKQNKFWNEACQKLKDRPELKGMHTFLRAWAEQCCKRFDLGFLDLTIFADPQRQKVRRIWFWVGSHAERAAFLDEAEALERQREAVAGAGFDTWVLKDPYPSLDVAEARREP